MAKFSPIVTVTAEKAEDHRVAALRRVLADRERELLDLKGPCGNTKCSLHYAHSGPCDTTRAEGQP